MHISFKIIIFLLLLCCSTCLGHNCVHHQEFLIAAHAVSGHRVVLGRLFSPAGGNNKIIKSLFYFYAARHVWDTTVSIIRSFYLLHMQSVVTVWCWVGCFLQPCSVVTAAESSSNNRTRLQLTQHHTVTRDCMCSNKKLLMMGTVVSETCRAAVSSNNRTRLEETTDPTPHGDQRLHVQQ
jgi:hypothetical protein